MDTLSFVTLALALIFVFGLFAFGATLNICTTSGPSKQHLIIKRVNTRDDDDTLRDGDTIMLEEAPVEEEDGDKRHAA
jgi:hypothetical protein